MKIKGVAILLLILSSHSAVAGMMYRYPVHGVESQYLLESEVTPEESYAIWYNYATENNIYFSEDFSSFGIDLENSRIDTVTAPLPSAPYPNNNPQDIVFATDSPYVNDFSAFSSVESVFSFTIAALQGGIKDVDFLSNVKSFTQIAIRSRDLSDISGLANIPENAFYNSNVILTGDFSDISALSDATNLNHFYLNSPNVDDLSPLSNMGTVGTILIGWPNTGFSDLTPLSEIAVLRKYGSYIGGIESYTGPKMASDSDFCVSVSNPGKIIGFETSAGISMKTSNSYNEYAVEYRNNMCEQGAE